MPAHLLALSDTLIRKIIHLLQPNECLALTQLHTRLQSNALAVVVNKVTQQGQIDYALASFNSGHIAACRAIIQSNPSDVVLDAVCYTAMFDDGVHAQLQCPLAFPAQRGQYDFFQFLLPQLENLLKGRKNKKQALVYRLACHAIISRQISVSELLIKECDDVNWRPQRNPENDDTIRCAYRNSTFPTLLALAAKHGMDAIVELLLCGDITKSNTIANANLIWRDESDDTNYYSGKEWKAINYAVAADNINIVKLLLDRTDFNHITLNQETYAISLAVELERKTMVLLLVEHYKIHVLRETQRDTFEQMLTVAAQNKDSEMLKFLCDELEWNVVSEVLASETGLFNALWVATHAGNLENVAYLIEKGVNVNAGDPLWEAVVKCKASIVKKLIRAGANTSIRGNKDDKRTLLHESCYNLALDQDSGAEARNADAFETFLALLDGGCDVNATDALGNTCLHVLSGLDDPSGVIPQAIKMLINAGADVRHRNNEGLTAVEAAKRRKSFSNSRMDKDDQVVALLKQVDDLIYGDGENSKQSDEKTP